MNVLILGASGMIGQGALRECLLDPSVARVVTLGRGATSQRHAKLQHIVHADLLDLGTIEDQLTNLNACFYCVGATSAGATEAEYTRVNHDITLAVARTLARVSPGMTFVYVSGKGTDSTERGRVMWARVKGRVENELHGSRRARDAAARADRLSVGHSRERRHRPARCRQQYYVGRNDELLTPTDPNR